MLIFEQEKKDGLEQAIAESNSIAFELIPGKSEDTNLDAMMKGFAGVPNLIDIVKKIDLFYFESVLASVGWNKNDDIFDPRELWAARNTPVDKKINYMHNEADIIGHMTWARVLDQEGKLILDTINDKDIPTNFDVVVGGVLYKHWEDKLLLERMHQIIDSVSNKSTAVSMECIFPNFDYGVITPDGQHKIIARAENTSFLSKHLRKFGGTGSYEGNKVGRLLRNMVFTGKAIVGKPANPRSLIIRSEGSKFLGSTATISIFNKSEIKIMDVTLTQEKYDALLKRAEAADNAAKEALEKTADEYKKASKTQAEENVKLKDELAKAQETLKKVGDELLAAKEVSKANEDKSTTLASQLKDLETKLNETKAAMEKKDKEDKMNARKTACAEREIEEAKANDLLAKFADVSDELFNHVIEAYPKKAVTAALTNKDVLASAQMTSANATVISDTQKALSAKATEWFASTLTKESK